MAPVMVCSTVAFACEIAAFAQRVSGIATVHVSTRVVQTVSTAALVGASAAMRLSAGKVAVPVMDRASRSVQGSVWIRGNQALTVVAVGAIAQSA